MNSEPILTEDRLRLYPIKYADIWEFYKCSVAAFWVPDEISLVDDVTDWAKLDEQERHFILMVLGFFANSDFIVNENLDDEFCELVKIPELKMFYHYQEMMEDIHSQMYQLLIDTLVPYEETKEHLFNSIKTIDSIKAKAEWARKWISTGSFVQRLVAFSIVEGIFFSGSFCSIFWLKKRGLMPGLCQSNELISRDEGMHRDLACLVYREHIINKIEPSLIKEMVKEAVDIEMGFVSESLPYNLKGMNKELMCQYIQYVADHLLVNLVGDRMYFVTQPFPWMDLLSIEVKNNFFERRGTSYSKSACMSTAKENQISFDEDF